MEKAQPEMAGDSPIPVDLEEGKTVWWCAFCDGSHAGTGLEPVAYTPKRSKTFYLCACKQTRNSPLCDGSHNSLAPAAD